MLKGAVDSLTISNPEFISTDVGPVIDFSAKEKILAHVNSFDKKYHSSEVYEKGNFVNPAIIEINNIDEINEEIFGPVLHVLSFSSKKLVELCNQINSLNYGLTLGIHSRINSVIETVINNTFPYLNVLILFSSYILFDSKPRIFLISIISLLALILLIVSPLTLNNFPFIG